MKEPITADNLIEKREAYGLIAAEMAREQPAIEVETFELSASLSRQFQGAIIFSSLTNVDNSLPCLL